MVMTGLSAYYNTSQWCKSFSYYKNTGNLTKLVQSEYLDNLLKNSFAFSAAAFLKVFFCLSTDFIKLDRVST